MKTFIGDKEEEIDRLFWRKEVELQESALESRQRMEGKSEQGGSPGRAG